MRPAGGAHPVVCVGPNTPILVTGTLYCQKAPTFDEFNDERLNRGPDSLWSLKNTMAFLVKSRGVTPGVQTKFSPLALINCGLLIIPIHFIGSMTLSPLHL